MLDNIVVPGIDDEDEDKDASYIPAGIRRKPAPTLSDLYEDEDEDEFEAVTPKPTEDFDSHIFSASQSQQAAFSASVWNALGVDPVKQEAAIETAQKLNLPVEAVNALGDEATHQAKYNEVMKYTEGDLDYQTVLAWDTDRAAARYYDFANTNRMWYNLKSLGGELVAALYDIGGAFQAGAEHFYKLRAHHTEDKAKRDELLASAEEWRQAGLTTKRLQEDITGDASTYGRAMRWTSSAIRSFGLLVVSGGVGGVIPGVMRAGAARALVGGVTLGQMSGAALDKGLPPWDAARAAVIDGAIEVATEWVPMGRLFGGGLIKSVAKGGWKKAARYAGEEVFGEVAATVGQDINAWLHLRKEEDFDTWIRAMPEKVGDTIASTLILVGGMGAGGAAVHRFSAVESKRTRDAEQALQSDAKVEDVMEAAKKSKLSPDNKAAFISQSLSLITAPPTVADPDAELTLETAAQTNPKTEVHINVAAAEEAGITSDELAQLFQTAAPQMDVAVPFGADISIPVGEFISRTLDHAKRETLRDLARIGSSGLTRVEAKSYAKEHAAALKESVIQVIDEIANEVVEAQEATKIEEKFVGMFQAAKHFPPAQAKAYSKFFSSFFAVQAQRLGITAEEMYERYPVKITSSLANQILSGKASSFFQEYDDSYDDDYDELSKYAKDFERLKLTEVEESAGGGEAATLQEHLAQIKTEPTIAPTPETTTTPTPTPETATTPTAESTPTAEQPPTAEPTAEPVAEPAAAEAVIGAPAEVQQDELQEARGPRGAFSPQDLKIALHKEADLSTFLHEAGHFFLHVQFDIATQLKQEADISEAAQQIVKDADTLLKDFGVESLEAWNSMSTDEQRPHHEKFARGFEKYLFEGKSPNVEMQDIFTRFRDWLLHIYKSVQNLNIEISPTVREVMDRMLATDAQIAITAQSNHIKPLFTSAKQAGMTDAAYANYVQQSLETTNAAIAHLQSKGMKDLQWIREHKSDILDKLREINEPRRKELRAEAEAAVDAMPIQQTIKALTEDETSKLNLAALKEMEVPSEVLDKLEMLDVVSTEGSHPEVIADTLGHTSGSALVKALSTANTREVEIDRHIDQKLLGRYGEVNTPEAVESQSRQSFYTEERGKAIVSEVNTLARQLRQPPVSTKVLAAQAKQTVAQIKLSMLRPLTFANAAERHAGLAARALAKKDYAAAAKAKRNQTIAHYATMEAYKAKAEVEKSLNLLKAVDTSKFSEEYAEQIDELLNRFDLRKSVTDKAAEKSFEEFIKELQNELNYKDLGIPKELLNASFRMHYRQMSVEQFRGLVDAVKALTHLARQENRMIQDFKFQDLSILSDKLTANVEDYDTSLKPPDNFTPATWQGKVGDNFRGFFFAHIKSTTMCRVFDGWKHGIWQSTFVHTANECAAKEAAERDEYMKRIGEALRPVSKSLNSKKKYDFNFNGKPFSYTQGQLFVAGLYMGNEQNRQRYRDGIGLTDAQVDLVMSHLTKEHWDAIQNIWDIYETLFPRHDAMKRKLTSRPLKRVEPKAFKVRTASGEVIEKPGGYFPIVYDSRASVRASEVEEVGLIKRRMQAVTRRASARSSASHERVAEITGRPVLLEPGTIFSKAAEAIHYLNWQPWLIDTSRLLRSKNVTRAIVEHHGKDIYDEFTGWIKGIADAGVTPDRGINQWLANARSNLTFSLLAYNMKVWLTQYTGIFQGAAYHGWKHTVGGAVEMLISPAETSKFIAQNSTFMNKRSFSREVAESRRLAAMKKPSAYQTYGSSLMLMAQKLADNVTWAGAYRHAIEQGLTHVDAVNASNETVAAVQGSGDIHQQPKILRSTNEFLKMWTMFNTYWNSQLNIIAGAGMAAPKGKKAKAVVLAYFNSVIAAQILFEVIDLALTGGGDEEKDLAWWGRKAFQVGCSPVMSLFIAIREFQGIVDYFVDNKYVPRYQGPTGLKPLDYIYDLAVQVRQGDLDIAAARAALGVAGIFVRLPVAQLNRMLGGGKALAEGKTENWMALLYGYKQPSKEKKVTWEMTE